MIRSTLFAPTPRIDAAPRREVESAEAWTVEVMPGSFMVSSTVTMEMLKQMSDAEILLPPHVPKFYGRSLPEMLREW